MTIYKALNMAKSYCSVPKKLDSFVSIIICWLNVLCVTYLRQQ